MNRIHLSLFNDYYPSLTSILKIGVLNLKIGYSSPSLKIL